MDILKSNFKTLVDILFKAKRQVVLSLPNINTELADTIIDLKTKGLQITVFIEIDEQSYRTGYGEIEALKKLTASNVTVRDKKSVNLYFIIVDSIGYFHFPKSRFTEEEGIAYDLFPMEPNQVKTLKFLFGVLDEEDEIEDEIIEHIDLNVIQTITGSIKTPDKETIKELITTIQNDPPLKPEYNRKLSVYTAKFQFGELKFKGANLHVKKIKLPSNALPFRDAKLKKAVEANLRMFTELPEQEFMKPFFDLKIEVEILRDKYLVYLKERDKNLIKREKKAEFEKELILIQKKVEEVKKALLNKLQAEIGKSRDSIMGNLAEFLQVNQVDNLIGLEGETLKKEIEYTARQIVSKIHFPSASKLLEGISFTHSFYDITWDDLNNPKVLKEMVEKKLIRPDDASFISENVIGVADEKSGILF